MLVSGFTFNQHVIQICLHTIQPSKYCIHNLLGNAQNYFYSERKSVDPQIVNKLGLPIFLQVFSLIIVIADPVFNCNFIFILLIMTKTNFLFGDVSFEILLIFFFSFVDFT